ncbi:MAG: succinate dehydrogenase, hydrophobic membrane anchor protein [Anaerolineales bacterium]|jgi:succinate dehydrogenase / fumarate reductase membrane anchor subunit
MQTSRSIRSAGVFEYGMWLFTRISGLALIILGAISLAAAFLLGGRTQMDMPTMFRWMFFPNPNHVVNSNIPDVSLGWSNAFWQIYSMLVIFFAAVHGLNGLRMVLEDYIENAFIVALMRIIVMVLLVGGAIVAIYVILAS